MKHDRYLPIVEDSLQYLRLFKQRRGFNNPKFARWLSEHGILFPGLNTLWRWLRENRKLQPREEEMVRQLAVAVRYCSGELVENTGQPSVMRVEALEALKSAEREIAQARAMLGDGKRGV